MVRVRIGRSWTQNPDLQTFLRLLAEGRSRSFSPRSIVDCLQIEVNGADLTAGTFRVPVIDTLRDLQRAVFRSFAGATVVFDSSGDASLTLTSDESTTRLLYRRNGVSMLEAAGTVETNALLEALRRVSGEVHAEFLRVGTGLCDLRVVRSLVEPIRRSRTDGVSVIGQAPRWTAQAPVNDWAFVIREGRQTLHLIDAGGHVRWSGGRAAKVIPQIAAAFADERNPLGIHRNPTTETVTFGRSIPFGTDSVLRALRALHPTLQLPNGARAPGPATLRLITGSAEPKAEAPDLPSRGLRRVSFRKTWSHDTGESNPIVSAVGDRILIRSAHHVELMSRGGESMWRHSIDHAQLFRRRDRHLLVGARDSRELTLRSAESGEIEWRSFIGFVRQLRGAFVLSDSDTLVVHDETRILGLEMDGTPRWTKELRERFLLVSSGGGFVSLSASGEFAAFDGHGQLIWRSGTDLRTVETLQLDAATGLVLAAGRDETGFHLVAVFDCTHGDLVTHRRVTPGWVATPVLLGSQVFFARTSKGRTTLSAIDVKSGRGRLDVTLPVRADVALRGENDGIWFAGCGGEWVRTNTDGSVTQYHPVRDPDPSLSPRKPRPVLLTDKLVISVGTHVHVADLDTGRPLASLEPTELAPASLCVVDGPLIVAAGAGGGVQAWQSSGHLGVVLS